MTKTYTSTRQSYYEKIIRDKRKKKYYENIESERNSALDRHYNNKERNNKKSLENYHKPKLKKK